MVMRCKRHRTVAGFLVALTVSSILGGALAAANSLPSWSPERQISIHDNYKDHKPYIFGAISLVGVATGTTSCTPPTHSIGDIIVIFAFRAGNTGAPSLGAGFTSILTKSGTSCAARLGYRIANATNDASGTWTNATALVCHVYTSSLYSSGSSMAIGGSASSSSINTTINFPTITMTNGGGTSWVSGFAGVDNTSQTISSAPSGMTNQSLETAAGSQAAGFDTNGAVSSWSSTNATDTGTAGDSVSCTLEICENVPPAAISNFIQHTSTQPIVTNQVGETCNNYVVSCPDPTLAGNGLALCVAYPSGATPAITDDKGNTWPTSGGAGTVTVDAGAGNMAMQFFILTNAATGTRKVTINFGSTTQAPVRTWLTQLYNVTGTIEGHATAAAVNTAGVVAPGTFTPSVANCVVLSYMSDSNTAGTTNPSLIQAANGYFLNDSDISWKGGTGTPSASQAALQTTAVSTNALFNLAIGGSETYNVLSVALSTGSQGTPKPTGIHIDRVLFFSTANNPASYTLQIPATGNCGLLIATEDLAGDGSTTATDSDSVSWMQAIVGGGFPLMWWRGSSPQNPGRTITLNYTGHTGTNLDLKYYDISGAAAAPFDTYATATPGTMSNVNSVASAPSITPSTANGLVVACLQEGTGPTIDITSPAGALYDHPYYDVWQGVAGIASTTMTVASTTWGTLGVGGGAGDLRGGTVVVGTTPQSGSGPYTVQPSQTVSSGTTMNQHGSDVNTVNWGNGLAHFYNPDTSALSFTWSISNQPSNQGTASAIALKAPVPYSGPPCVLPTIVRIH